MDRQTDRKTDIRQTGGRLDRWTDGHRDRWIDGQTYGQSVGRADTGRYGDACTSKKLLTLGNSTLNHSQLKILRALKLSITERIRALHFLNRAINF